MLHVVAGEVAQPLCAIRDGTVDDRGVARWRRVGPTASLSVATTFQPLSANSLAVAWPTPVDEPVISTVFLFMLFLL
jgi:hypothetical protein